MSSVKEILLVLLVVAAIGTVKTSDHAVCDDETQVKLSILFGMHQNLMMKEISAKELEKSIVETEQLLNITQQRAEEIHTSILNTTTQELEDLGDSNICENGFARDCCKLKKMLPSAESGLYAITDPCSGERPFNYAKLTVNCDMETDGGGWIVIQRRNASMGWVNFTRSWGDYENGFGDLDGEFWIGLKNIYELTNQQQMQLKILVWNDTNNVVTCNYQHFKIDSQIQNYRILTASGASGNFNYGPFLVSSSNIFSTYDHNYHNCAYTYQSGWWHYQCAYANLNGRHQPTDLPGVDPLRQRLVWRTGSSQYTVYTHSEMKIRPQSCGLS